MYAFPHVPGNILSTITDSGGGVGLESCEPGNLKQSSGTGSEMTLPANAILMSHCEERRGSNVSPADVQKLTIYIN